MEFVWRPLAADRDGNETAHATSANDNDVDVAVESDSIFAHILHTHYSAPEGFDW